MGTKGNRRIIFVGAISGRRAAMAKVIRNSLAAQEYSRSVFEKPDRAEPVTSASVHKFNTVRSTSRANNRSAIKAGRHVIAVSSRWSKPPSGNSRTSRFGHVLSSRQELAAAYYYRNPQNTFPGIISPPNRQHRSNSRRFCTNVQQ